MDSEGPSAGPSSLTDAHPRIRPQYDAAQIGRIERCYRQTPKLGADAILKKYPDLGFSLEGLKSAVSLLNKFGAVERQVGSGRKRTRRAPDATESAKAYFEDSKFATSGDSPRDLRIPKTTARWLISEDVDLDPLRGITTQMARPRNVAERLELRKIRDGEIRSGSLGVKKSSLQTGKFAGSEHVRAGAETLLLSGRRSILRRKKPQAA